MCTHTPRPPCGRVPPIRNLDPEPKPRSPQVGVVQLDALTNLFGANCQWETSARTASDKTGCWGEQIPLHEGGGQWGRMCWCAAGGWGGTMDGLVSPLADWFEMAPLSLSPWGVPLSCFWFPLLTNSKQKSISFSRRGGGYWTVFQMGKVTQKYVFARDGRLSNSNSPSISFSLLLSAFILLICSLDCPAVLLHSGVLNDVFPDSRGVGAPVGGLDTALLWGSLILKYTEMPSLAGLKSVWCRPWVPSLDRPLLSVTCEEPSFLFLSSSFLFPSLKRLVNKLWQLSRAA